MQFEFLVVVCERDLSMSKALISSIISHCKLEHYSILVVINEIGSIASSLLESLSAYRMLLGIPDSKLRVNLGSDFALLKLWLRLGHSGWWTQQLLKLKCSSRTKTDAVVVLDSKNYFVKDFDETIFIKDSTGQFFTEIYDYSSHPLFESLKKHIDIFDAQSNYLYKSKYFPACVTPQILIPHICSKMTNLWFFEFTFMAERLNEFFLYFCCVAALGENNRYTERPISLSATLWNDSPESIADFNYRASAAFVISVHHSVRRNAEAVALPPEYFTALSQMGSGANSKSAQMVTFGKFRRRIIKVFLLPFGFIGIMLLRVRLRYVRKS